MDASHNERREGDRDPCPPGERCVITPYITRNGKRIYHPDYPEPSGVFVFCVPEEEYRQDD